jgi:hypothetical protein
MAHPLSVLRAPDGRQVQLNVRGCVWSGDFPVNSLAAISECLTAPVARATIDFTWPRDSDFLSAVVDLLRTQASPSVLQLTATDVAPWPYSRVDQLATLLEPVRGQVIVASCADWNLRRLVQVDSRIRVGFMPTLYLDWAQADVAADEFPGEIGAYGYRDRHPLARTRNQPTSDYLWERINGLVRLVPGACEMHLRLSLFEQMQSDGLGDTAHRLHRAGLRVGVWTLDAGTPDWQARVNNAVWAGVDMVTTNTAQQLAEARIR